MGSDFNLEQFERNRTDRRDLLKYVLACNRQNVLTPPGILSLEELDYDNINVQFVIDRASKGLVFDITDAYISREACYSTEAVSTVTTASEAEVAEPPPAPDVSVSGSPQRLPATELRMSLPRFETGLSKDDIRETAYEVLLASVGAAVGLMSLTKEKKEDISRSGKWKSQSNTSGLAGLISVMRRQLQITEESDQRTTEALFHASNGRLGKRIDCLLLPLELLSNTSREDFSDASAFPLWQKRQLNILKEGILNNFHWNLERSDLFAVELMSSISNAEETAAMPASKGSRHRAHDALKRIKDICSAILERSGKPDEVCHWADGYFLNVHLYERLLSGTLDSVKQDRFIEEVEEVLELLKSTWRVLGINHIVHDTCYAWVLFKQFVKTGELSLLQHASSQMKKIASDRQRSAADRTYLRNLRCTMNGVSLSFVQSVLGPIKSWIDEALHDYHLYFLDDRIKMETLLACAMTVGRLLADEDTTKPPGANTFIVAKQAEEYVSSSVKRAYERVSVYSSEEQTEDSQHRRLIVLAESVKKLADRDISLFSPLFSRLDTASTAITASVLHASYYKQLKPYLEKSSLSTDDNVISVLSAADDLEQYLQELAASVDNGDDKLNHYKKQMIPFEVENIIGNLSKRCLTERFDEVSKFVENAFNNENWEPSSTEDRYGRSALDIFQTIEKVADSFFEIKFPLRISHLKDLTDGINTLMELYSKKIVTQLGEKADLIPPAPALKRSRKELSIKPFTKKKVADPRLPDDKRCGEVNSFTTAKLCVRLNTLQFLQHQLETLEGSIKERWSAKLPRKQVIKLKQSEELIPGFDASRKVVAWALGQTCEFTGFKLIFWDMRGAFVDSLYNGGVAQFRMEKVIHGLDSVLGQLCELLMHSLRDQVVYGLLEASLEGFLWVLLDGGPLRSFSQNDAEMLEQDLNFLKEFFIADGDGLPRNIVTNAATQVHQIVNLYRLETHDVVEKYRRATEQSSLSIKTMPPVLDSDILLRVLHHRKDKEASKFIKQLKLPKP